MTIYNWILGIIGDRDDHTGVGGNANPYITDVSGWLNGTPNSLLSLSSYTQITSGSDQTGWGQQFSAGKTLNLGTFSGAQNFSLRFTWTMYAASPQITSGGDEPAVRLGHDAVLAGMPPNEYPGIPSRVQPNDGHYVSIVAAVTYIPEPSTLALAVLGGLGLAAIHWRRSRRGP